MRFELPSLKRTLEGMAAEASVGWITPSDVEANQAYLHTLGDQIERAVAACTALDDAQRADWHSEREKINEYLAQSPSWIYAAMQLMVGQVHVANIDQYWKPLLSSKGCSVDPPPPEPPPVNPWWPVPPGGSGLLPGSMTELGLWALALLYLSNKLR